MAWEPPDPTVQFVAPLVFAPAVAAFPKKAKLPERPPVPVVCKAKLWVTLTVDYESGKASLLRESVLCFSGPRLQELLRKLSTRIHQ